MRVGVAAGIALAVVTIYLAESLPAPTVTLVAEGDDVVATGGAIDHMVVTGLRSERGQASLEPGDLSEEPDVLQTWASYNRFFARQGALANVLAVPDAELVDADGAAHPVQVGTRSFFELPAVSSSSGVDSVHSGGISWCRHPRERAATSVTIATKAVVSTGPRTPRAPTRSSISATP